MLLGRWEHPWIRFVFLRVMPTLLFIRRPKSAASRHAEAAAAAAAVSAGPLLKSATLYMDKLVVMEAATPTDTMTTAAALPSIVPLGLPVTPNSPGARGADLAMPNQSPIKYFTYMRDNLDRICDSSANSPLLYKRSVGDAQTQKTSDGSALTGAATFKQRLFMAPPSTAAAVRNMNSGGGGGTSASLVHYSLRKKYNSYHDLLLDNEAAMAAASVATSPATAYATITTPSRRHRQPLQPHSVHTEPISRKHAPPAHLPQSPPNVAMNTTTTMSVMAATTTTTTGGTGGKRGESFDWETAAAISERRTATQQQQSTSRVVLVGAKAPIEQGRNKSRLYNIELIKKSFELRDTPKTTPLDFDPTYVASASTPGSLRKSAVSSKYAKLSPQRRALPIVADRSQSQSNSHSHSPSHSHSYSQSQMQTPTATSSRRKPSHKIVSLENIKPTASLIKACYSIEYIASILKAKAEISSAKEDWKYMAAVLDRLMLIIFFLVTCIGTYESLFLGAPFLFETIDQENLIRMNSFYKDRDER